MTNEIQIFKFNDHPVRVAEKDGEPWWVAKDVCEILELGNPRSSLALLEDDEKSSVQIMDGTSPLGGNPNMTIISEAGLYRLIMRSRKPQAKAFQRWITHEVLPTIRKTGGYLTPAKAEEILFNPDAIISLAMQIKQLRAERDEAIRTKYHIMAGRDATAMNTASRAVQRAKKAEAELAELKNEIGVGEEWKKLKPLKWPAKYFMLTKGFRSVFGKYVKDWCEEHGIEPHKVPDPDYGAVNAYPAWALETIRKEIEKSIPAILVRYAKKGR